MNMMKFYRTEREEETNSNAVEGNFGSASSENDLKEFNESNVKLIEDGKISPKKSPKTIPVAPKHNRNASPMLIIDDEMEL